MIRSCAFTAFALILAVPLWAADPPAQRHAPRDLLTNQPPAPALQAPLVQPGQPNRNSQRAAVQNGNNGNGNNGNQNNNVNNQGQNQQNGQGAAGGYGGNGPQYVSKRADLTKEFAGYGEAAQKNIADASKGFKEETAKMTDSTLKQITDSTAKDVVIDDKTKTALSTTTGYNTAAIKDRADVLIATIQKLSDSQLMKTVQSGQMEQSILHLQAGAAIQQEHKGMTIGERIQSHLGYSFYPMQGSMGGLGSRGPASTTPALDHSTGPNGGAALSLVTGPKAFQRGVLHNPPAGLNIQ